MSVKTKHDTEYSTWFVTFTCYQWRQLFEIGDAYDLVYNWFSHLQENKKADVLVYVIMPNHVHVILDLKDKKISLDKIVGNGKRFMAIQLIERLKERKEMKLIKELENAVSSREKAKGQKHKVFEESFDAKAICTPKFLFQKVTYIHNNPVKGKWSLVNEYTDYEHSSASYYELGIVKHFEPKSYAGIFERIA